MSCSDTEASLVDARRQALLGVADALATLAARLRGRAMVSRDFAHLTDRARALAGAAWEMRTSRWSFEENAQRLAAGLEVFAREAEAASRRAVVETESNMVVVEALISRAHRIAELGQGVASRQDTIRAELEPLEATLLHLRARIAAGGSVVEDAQTLARQAATLSGCAQGLRGGGRQAAEAAAAITQALGTFVEEATGIAARMSSASAGLSQVVTGMATGAREMHRQFGDPTMRVVWR